MRYALVLLVLFVLCLLSACDGGYSDLLECEEYEPVDLIIDFVGFDDYVGQEVFLRMTGTTNWNPPNPGPWEEIFRTSMVIPAGDFSFDQAAGATSCLALHADFFVDVNENGVYDAPPTDHAWRLYLHVWEDDDVVEVLFTFTVDPDDCRYSAGEVDSSCMYGDIEWPAP